MITRENFVKICTACIQETRDCVTPRNQVSGYLQYHEEIRDNDYFKNLRHIKESHEIRYGYSLYDQYKLIKQGRMGNCYELAEFLSVRLLKYFQKENISAKVQVVSSLAADNVYVHVEILLKGEKGKTTWEVDAWDPRIIDISVRLDGSIKNKEQLHYGTRRRLEHGTSTNDFKRRKISNDAFFAIKKPVEGPPQRSPTPEREVCKKYTYMYQDYTLEEAHNDKKLDIMDGTLHYLQRKSTWQ